MFSDFMFCFCCVWFLLLVQRSEAKARTDPVEVRALNSIFQQWGISALPTWNISGEPCSGDAISGKSIDDGDFNPGIKCDDCSSNNGTTCHIIRLKAVSMDIQGTIPQEIANLPKLFSLNLNENLLTGPLPAFLGNLTDMLYLTVGTNALSGTVPKELGNLRKLLILSINVNNFTGPLPPELGNLTNLEQLYIGSCGLSGEIPSTFANLRNLQTVWAEDNQFTGKLPDFIGKWTSLSVLRIHGSSFEGPIPSTFSNLTSLTDLRLSELYNRSSSLEFIKEMKSLSILILRNCMISGSLPSNMGQYQSLEQLDLSFNNITGELPTSLFSLSSLSFLFLGNNLLSGTLPAIKSDTLLAIDLSYNGLSGSFPSWVNQANLQLNLVGNFFVLDSSNSSGLPTGLNCLQRTFPCYRGSPRYYKFAIKCGGRQIISSRGTVFEQDSENLGAASYYVTDENNWAVSSTGRFNDNANASYTRTHSSQFTNTLDSELFQTARLSPGSLRYYGLGLENGMYTVNLQFAETDFPNSPVWRSVGKRVFNIFIQGSLASKDFDIRKEAGGISFRAVSKNFKANVTENFLEIHLFWAGKGTLLVPVQGIYGPSISAVSVTPDFEPTVSPPDTTSSKKKRTGLIAVVVVAAGVVGFVAFFAVLIFRQRRKRMSFDDDELMGMDAKPNTFGYAELRTATEDFIPSNKLGEGGFGPVYKGKLSDGRTVAVKQLSMQSRQGKSQFVAEIAAISAVQHRNLVRLYGCCIEGERRLLVYEYLENKSLDQALFGKSMLHLDWPTRFRICLGTARGLAYLHEDSKPRIVHRDVKASNILLDADLNPKISDFGLAKLYDDEKSHISTKVVGTIGYLAPEYAMRGHLTEKADVFGFGVVALEILSGRPNSDSRLDTEKIYLLEWAWHLHENNRELELVDQTLEEFDATEVIRMTGVALLCTQTLPMLRPPMSRVVGMLSGDIEVATVTSRPSYLIDWQFQGMSSTVSGDALTVTTTKSPLDTSSPSMGYSSDRPSVMEAQPLAYEVTEEGR